MLFDRNERVRPCVCFSWFAESFHWRPSQISLRSRQMTVFKLEGERNNENNNNRRHVTRKKKRLVRILPWHRIIKKLSRKWYQQLWKLSLSPSLARQISLVAGIRWETGLDSFVQENPCATNGQTYGTLNFVWQTTHSIWRDAIQTTDIAESGKSSACITLIIIFLVFVFILNGLYVVPSIFWWGNFDTLATFVSQTRNPSPPPYPLQVRTRQKKNWRSGVNRCTRNL